MSDVPVQVTIGVQILTPLVEGNSIKERFICAINPRYMREAAFMCQNEEEEFKVAVGAVMASYGVGTPEFEHISVELKQLARVTAMINSASLGMEISVPEAPKDFSPTGLMGLWRNRTK